MGAYIRIFEDKWRAIHSIKAIKKTEREKLAAALLDYGCLGVEPSGLSNIAQGMFDAIKTSLAPSGRGAPMGNQNARKDNSENNSKTIIENNSENNSLNNSEKNKKNNSVQNTEYRIQNTETETPKSPTRGKSPSRFHKPSVDEVRTYILENNYHVNPNDFVDFYESKGWLVGKSPMKDWKAAVRTWESKEKNENPAKFIEVEKDEYHPIVPMEKCSVCGSRNTSTKGIYSFCLDCNCSFTWRSRTGEWKEDA